jgi:hypothetical protein
VRILLAFLACTAFAGAAVEDLVTLNAEYRLSWADIPVLSDALEEALEWGDIEIRQQVRYDAPERQLIVWTFVASPSWPRPASLVDVQNNQLDQFRIDVTRIGFTDASWRTIKFEGALATLSTVALMVAGGYQTSMAGAAPGAPVRFRASYLPESREARLTNTTLLVSGGARIFVPEAIGSVVLEKAANRPPVPVVIGPPDETSNPEIAFDATTSSDPDGDEIDFKWHVLGGSVSLRGCETPTPVFQFHQGSGIYDFRLTLTDARGATAIRTYRVRYSGR